MAGSLLETTDKSEKTTVSYGSSKRSEIMMIGGEIGPHVDIYELFHWQRLQAQRENAAAVKIQRTWRAFAAARQLKKLKFKVMLEMGLSWTEFMSKYTDTLQRVQQSRRGNVHDEHGRTAAGRAAASRPGIDPCLDFTLHDVDKFVVKSIKLMKVFESVAIDGRIEKERLGEFFESAQLFPAEKEIKSAFSATYSGCEGRGEMIFIIDTGLQPSEHIFTAQQNFVKDVITSLSSCIGPDSVRLGYIYNTATNSQQFGLIGFSSSRDVHVAVDHMEFSTSESRLESALLAMNQLMSREGRADVFKTVIVLTAHNNHTTNTRQQHHQQQQQHGAGGSRTSVHQVAMATRRRSSVTGAQSLSLAGHKSSGRTPSIAAGGGSAAAAGSSRRVSVVVRSTSPGAATGAARRKSIATPVNTAVLEQLQVAKNNGINVMFIVTGGDSDARKYKELASRPDLAFSSSDSKTVANIKKEVTSSVCARDCPHCRYYGPADKQRHTQQPSGQPRGLYREEVLQLVWTLYPPSGSDVDPVRKSTWMRPVVGDEEVNGGRLVASRHGSALFNSYRTARLRGAVKHNSNSADLKTCLRLVFAARLEREGVLHLPVGVDGVENVTDAARAMELANLYLTDTNC